MEPALLVPTQRHRMASRCRQAGVITPDAIENQRYIWKGESLCRLLRGSTSVGLIRFQGLTPLANNYRPSGPGCTKSVKDV
jgi:hypothetical protein